MDERVQAFIAAYDAFVEAERDYRGLGGYVAPKQETIREKTDRYYAAARALEAARTTLGEPGGGGQQQPGRSEG